MGVRKGLFGLREFVVLVVVCLTSAATANVFNTPTWSKSFSTATVQAGSTVTLTFVIDHTATPAIGFNFINGSFTDDLNAMLPGLASISGTVNNVCGAGSQLSGTTNITVTGINLQPATSCTFSLTLQVPATATAGTYTNTTSTFTGNVTTVPLSAFNMNPVTATLQVTAAPAAASATTAAAPLIADFLKRRASLLLSADPDLARRHWRLGDPVETPAEQQEEEPYSEEAPPGSKEAAGLRYVRMLEQAALTAAYGSPEVELALFGPRGKGVDVWAEGELALHGQGGASGVFGVAFAGVDVLLSPDILLGAIVQYDNTSSTNAATGEAHSAEGWSVGPYLTAQLTEGLYFDLRAAYGGSSNTVSPVGTYVDAYSVTNWLVSGALTGEIDTGEITLEPQLHLSYLHQSHAAHPRGGGGTTPAQTVGVGQADAGLAARYVLAETEDARIELRGAVLAVGNYTVTNGAAGAFGVHGRAELGTDILMESGARIELGLNYDGLGSSLQSFGGRFKFAVPVE